MSIAGRLLIFLVFLVAAPCYADSQAPSQAPAQVPGGSVGVFWIATQPSSLIKVFGSDELKKLKSSASTEVDPKTHKATRFRGVLLSALIDKALSGVSNDRKAQIDLVILKNAQGMEALIPRWFIDKFPMLLAGDRSIVPWTSKPEARKKGLPLETYFIPDVNEIELANYRQRYRTVFLKRRMDPVALYGEKLFVQDCLSCHDSAAGIVKAQNWAGHHPEVNGTPKLDDREQRALHSYLDIYKVENTVSATATR